MPRHSQRPRSLIGGALRGAGLALDEQKDASTARMPIDEEDTAKSRAQRRKTARSAAGPVGGRPPKRGVNINSLARPANQAHGRNKSLGAHTIGAVQDVAPQTNVVETLRGFLQSRWDAANCLLNLENMQDDPILAAANIRPPGAPGAHRDIGTAIWKLSGDMFPSMITLSLAGNGLSTLQPLSSLAQYLPKLANLSLERNELRWARDLDVLASKKHGLDALQELVLISNPMQQNAVDAGNEDGYRRDVLAKFPGLRILDMKPVSSVEHGFSQLFRGRASKKAGPEAAQVPLRNFPLQTKPGFIDGDAAQVVPEFLSLFFARYDQDRALLAPVYSEHALFSLSLNSSPPPRARAQRLMHTMPHQKELVLDRYIALGSRNILRSHTAKALLRTLHQGSRAIVAFQQRLPHTTHPLHDASKFVVDAWVLPNVDVQAQTSATEKPDALLFISVHGEFSEAPSQGLRSFDRVFIVAPTAPDSQAAQHGWPCLIVSDTLTIRHYSSSAAWAPDTLPTGPVTGPNVAPDAPAAGPLPAYLQSQEPFPNISPEQHTLALQLAAQTRLLYPMAVQCLADNAWDPARALANFSALQASHAIPATAFVPT
ncbi:nuclear mRNA export, poly(A)+RNA binding protein [Malassezia vespertilionis]|uniref:Mex67p n=1 Tax=Malassezia vespertilionis TaxID=2020962 RepID=A0A2N1JEN3_9BASI|nr:nuclear mRNA export, poly(A)+RNA binding protein [Malassezia vespertilionis]PKI85007.1 Mex67p [Malassezia vespertilionis]WFD05852.1 nuclear mRNA export, poly(A)+RNA binding protein [Malassezia vespertilionis]